MDTHVKNAYHPYLTGDTHSLDARRHHKVNELLLEDSLELTWD